MCNSIKSCSTSLSEVLSPSFKSTPLLMATGSAGPSSSSMMGMGMTSSMIVLLASALALKRPMSPPPLTPPISTMEEVSSAWAFPYKLPGSLGTVVVI